MEAKSLAKLFPSSSRQIAWSSVVTQVIISLDSSECNVATASEMVERQVGFDVLMDSKLYPLIYNEATLLHFVHYVTSAKTDHLGLFAKI